MQKIESVSELLTRINGLKLNGKSIGLVPTMGALHEGHKALVDQSVKDNDVTVVTIFVNPIQFNNREDLLKYPKTLVEDLVLLKSWGTALVFVPDEADMYPKKPLIKLDFGKITEVLEGKFRPGHFTGVGIVVMKFFNLVKPDKAYFGLKDFQQYLIIKELADTFLIPVKIVGISTQRTASGLAISSRNRNLSEKGLQIASNIFKGLNMAKELILDKMSIDHTIQSTRQFYRQVEGLEIEYFEILDPDTLDTTENTRSQPLLLSVAGYVENIRLIDNLYLQPD